MNGKVPIIVLNVQTERESGRKAQLSNIQAGKAVASIVRSTLGVKAMLKMMLDPIGGICMTNDGNAILREIDVVHPAAKSMIELSRAQDEEVGDGTTSVIILAGEMLKVSTDFFEKEIHPSVVVSGYYKALEDAINCAESIATPVNIENEQEINDIIKSCLATKFASKWDNLISDLALKAVKIVYNKESKVFDCDIKKYAKVEKIPGGELSECVVLDGVVLNVETERESGRKAQLSNIQAGKAVASIVRSTLGPKAMLKMMLDPIGGICMTNDGNAILREIDVVHPAAKSMIELSRAQDEEVGDGTTSVIILAGEMLKVSTDFFQKEIHPSVVVSGYYKALEDAINYAESIATPVNIENEQEINDIIKSCLATKFASKWDNLISDLALKAVKIVYNKESKVFDCDIKKYAKVEKIP